MDILEAIYDRRSVHVFEDEDVDDEDIGMLLEAVRWAPSARNRQPWEVIVVDDREKIEELAEIALEQEWMEDVPLLFVICTNRKVVEASFGERGELYAIQSTAAAAQNAALAALELDLATCWADVYDEELAEDVLECPDHVVPRIALAVGHPAEDPEPPEREDITDFSHYNVFGEVFRFKWEGASEHARKFKKRLIESLEKY